MYMYLYSLKGYELGSRNFGLETFDVVKGMQLVTTINLKKK